MEKTYGKTVLPLSRVKRIIKQDEDVHYCSNASALLISVATELFVEKLATEAYQLAKLQKRKGIRYRDVEDVVRKDDQFEFLSDLFSI
ncbi:DNA polymerase epsilon subunit C [Schizosaccharomyces pombe]|uniref:DNA polymerase epsilon subunit C n=2 Tax=Schizosaccharomyces pombe (strain 972 / ATCC 24843) TaxID=284812 RepID=DPB3_SCHPO|nr:histone-like transcription factor family (CBF/NF-Y) [Schizosaccharomyces pombe]C6Y4D0.1 RecName: Full=DNA polymerase epsilon subunit C; AltName: Full=DNA polymerase II subunit C [Schizosaccharomyces pombe 972h-]CBA11517.1 histone-like transcription factor family (CBF/NF-Y) [Schizosaccharomyces pombe]|eukprot:NP_001343092.1 histone-like transcription factor family (CBF/NF-Y) [Schizosaccharomyces pombe]